MSGHKAIRGKTLYRILFFGVIITALSVGLLTFWGVREVRRDAAVVAVENSARGLAGTITVLVNSVADANLTMGDHDLASLSPLVLRKSFSAAMKRQSGLEAILISDSKGLRYMLTRQEDGLMEGVPEKDDFSGLHWYFVGKDGKSHDRGMDTKFNLHTANAALAEELTHLEPGQINWRSAYRFHELGESWLTASTLVRAGGRDTMVSYVFPVERVVSQLAGAEKGGAEKVFLHWGSGKILPVTDNGDDKTEDSGEVTDEVIKAATSRLNTSNVLNDTPFSFDAEGEVWWGYVMPLSVFGDTMSLGVAVPRRNVVSTLTSDTFLQVFGGVLVLLAWMALFILHRNRSRIEALGRRQKSAMTAGDIIQLIAEGESRSLEFKQTLRFNLKSGKNGREIEHACMKTVAGFMNSDGGTLLVGVADNGKITGFEEDGFESPDKALLHFNNLVNQCIGTEFAPCLDTAVIEVEGRAVLRVHCFQAGAPAFLSTGKEEEFYIRSGPASRKLTLSQFYEWLQDH